MLLFILGIFGICLIEMIIEEYGWGNVLGAIGSIVIIAAGFFLISTGWAMYLIFLGLFVAIVVGICAYVIYFIKHPTERPYMIVLTILIIVILYLIPIVNDIVNDILGIFQT